MNVSLTPELEEFIASEVEAGRYRSASEAVRASIRLLQEETREREAKLEYLRNAVGVGVEEIERGEELSGDAIFGEILEGLISED